MTETAPTPASPPNPNPDDRTLAFIAYGLLFAAVFFVGVPALIAVVIAYAQRGQALSQVRSHFNFQIRIFWVSLVLTAVGAVLLLIGGVIGFGEMISLSAGEDSLWLEAGHLRHGATMIACLAAGALALAASVVWLLAAPAFGFIRLASERPVGQLAA